jgi:phenylalanine-4-hydroxylase
METSLLKNRYAGAPKAADWTIDQNWQSYTPEEHDRWDRLFRRQREVTRGRACEAALNAMAALELSPSGIPDMARLSDKRGAGLRPCA